MGNLSFRGLVRPSALQFGLLALVLTMLLVPQIPGTSPAAPSTPALVTPSSLPTSHRPAPPAAPTEAVTVLNRTEANLSSFWGVGVDASTPNGSAATQLNGTSLDWVEYPAGKLSDSFNMVNGSVWTFGYATPEGSNESDFVNWCNSIHCQAILSVPGEIDEPGFAAYEVSYTENVLHFHPAYWEIGDEPFGWTHFNISWPNWKGTDASHVNATQYAAVVGQYITAMRGVDSSIRILGLPGVGAGSASDVPWINATVALNGPRLAGVAVHEYPAENKGTGTVAQFYGTLGGTNGLRARLVADEQAINATCSSCHIPLFVDEYGSGTGTTGAWQPYMQTYPQVPYVAAEDIIMMTSSVYNAELYNLESAYNGSLFNATGQARPVDSLFSQVLSHFGPTLLNTSVTKAASGVYVAASESDENTTVSVLAVNTGTTNTVTLDLGGPLFPGYGSYATWEATNSTNGTFTSSSGFGSTTSWSLPPQAVVLVSVCRPDTSGVGGSTYSATFCESGLPAGTTWSVTLGGILQSSTGSTISFLEPNGTYSYTVGPVAGWRAPPPAGSVTVHGYNASVEVPWTAVTYPVNFTALNLSVGTPWSVTIGGTTTRSTAGSLSVPLANGTYPYAVGAAPGWSAVPTMGNVTVNGTSVSVTILWSQATYPVTFTEGGLPLGTNWSVTFDGQTQNTTGYVLAFAVPNGTFSYAVNSSSLETPSAPSGSLSVSGAPLAVNISWTDSPNPVIFEPVGLPSSLPWSVDLNGTPQRGTGNLSYNESTGSYRYTIGPVAGWTTSPYASSVAVSGATTVRIDWTQDVYNVTFLESNLPLKNLSWTGNWSATIDGKTLTTHLGTYLTFWLPNGTYCFAVSATDGWVATPASGCLTVNGTGQVVSPYFNRVFYSVTFIESGLPKGGQWWVNFTSREGQTSYSTTDVIRIYNGTYTFLIAAAARSYVAFPRMGVFTVAGGPLNITLTFGFGYNVTFVETNLTSGTNWTVSVANESSNWATTPDVGFFLPNGTYSYTVGIVPGFVTTQSGSFTVAGPGRTVPIDFTVARYAITFRETNLTSGEAWSVSVDDVANSSYSTQVSGMTANLTVWLPNGSRYVATYGAVLGWTPNPSSVTFSVQGKNESYSVYWVGTLYAVTFSESGLNLGLTWAVTLHGVSDPALWANGSAKAGSSIVFTVLDGSYTYQVGSIRNFTASENGTGTVDVAGGSVSESVQFAPFTYTLRFAPTGLPADKNWSVLLTGGNLGEPLFNYSVGGAITFQVQNGTYHFVVGYLGGWYAAPRNGSVTVDAAATNVAIAWALQLYTVTFTAADNATAGQNWSVVLNGTLGWNATGGPIEFFVPNGSYPFTVSPLTGLAASPRMGTEYVDGGDLLTTIVWTSAYVVTFTETGLATGATWSVTVNGTPLSSTTTTLNFSELDGHYRYAVSPPANWGCVPASGTLTVNGAAVGVALTCSLTTYTVTFNETGLPAGSAWSVAVGNQTDTAHVSSLSLSLPNGNWTYVVNGPEGWVTPNATGTVLVAGHDVTVSLAWSRPIYSVTFTEVGLPGGTSWSVTLNGSTVAGTGTSIVFEEANRAYTFSVGSVSGYTVSPSGGSVTVNGASVLVTVQFTSKANTNSANEILGVPVLETVGLLAVIVVVVALVWVATHRTPPQRKGPVQEYTPPTSGGTTDPAATPPAPPSA